MLGVEFQEFGTPMEKADLRAKLRAPVLHNTVFSGAGGACLPDVVCKQWN